MQAEKGLLHYHTPSVRQQMEKIFCKYKQFIPTGTLVQELFVTHLFLQQLILHSMNVGSQDEEKSDSRLVC